MAFGFLYPAVLLGLAALPVIWWLLRLVPPKPETEVFPPLRILLELVKREETPAKSPWWLTALRLLVAAIVIFALARPLLNPQANLAAGDGPLLIMIDNDWASVRDFDARIRTAEALVTNAGDNGRTVALATSVSAPTDAVTLTDAGAAATALAAIRPVAGRADRAGAIARLRAAAADAPQAPTLALLDSGIADAGDAELGAAITSDGTAPLARVLRFGGAVPSLVAIDATTNNADGFEVALTRTAAGAGAARVTLNDLQGRLLAEANAAFGISETATAVPFDIPFELRNDIASVTIVGEDHAGATFLLDENNKRRRVALLTGLAGDEAQPLLSPLLYISRAFAPFADMAEARTGDLAVDIPELLNQGPTLLVMADIGVMPQAVHDDISAWIDAGGTLVRFAGPRLAASANDDPFLPVDLRAGERELGGTLSWSQPQAVAPFPNESPFADLEAPRDVTVIRQVLAEPNIDLANRTWASLADGTPLVTGVRRGRGAIVLFHVTAEATWSNLPISGTFVDLLRRIADFARNTGVQGVSAGASEANGGSTVAASLAPWRILRADGVLVAPPGDVRPLDPASVAPVSFEHPAGLYGVPEGFVARNILAPGETLEPFVMPLTGIDTATAPLLEARTADLSGWLFAAALALLVIDTLAVLWINGRFAGAAGGARRQGKKAAAATSVAVLLVAGAALLSLFQPPALAQEPGSDDARPGDSLLLQKLETTRLAYVITGDRQVDEASSAGLTGLSRFLASRTAFEPGDPVGVDIETDELALYPLLYFPVSLSEAMPSPEAMARLDAYMQNGGSVLFDTRDQLTGALSAGTSPETRRLRDMLADLNVPPLEPVPADHVLTKSFYIVQNFPGRYSGSPLWVEAQIGAEEATADRPVRTGDGVTPIMITGNDFAAAWALDETGRPLYPITSGDPLQRIYAFRAGVNIMMYMLTGNYKADQVHIPALLERLGQ